MRTEAETTRPTRQHEPGVSTLLVVETNAEARAKVYLEVGSRTFTVPLGWLHIGPSEDSVGHDMRFILVMGDVENRDAAFFEVIARHFGQLQSSGDIDRGKGFVEKHDLRRLRQGPAKGHALGFTTGKIGDPSVLKAFQSNGF